MKKTVSILIVFSIFVSIFTINSIAATTEDKTGILIEYGMMSVYSDVNSENFKYELEKFTDEEISEVFALDLVEANISENGLKTEDLSYILNSLPNVIDLYCYGHEELSDISFIEGKTSLTYIDFDKNNISDISPIISCPNLDYIYFGYNKITDISPIYSLNKLYSVSFKNNLIEDVTGLKEYYEENAPFSHFFLDNNPLGNQLDYIKSINGSSKISLNGVYYPDEAATVTEAIELIETVEKTGLVYTYAENYCYMDNTFEMWRRYKSGDIGEVTSANCEYIHDCAGCWLDITYGEIDHWRNHIYPTFYCTHSLGPILMMTDKRPVQVVGFENPPIEEFYKLGHAGGHASGTEMVTLDNGAIVRSIHGPLKREPSHTTYEVYGTKGYLGSSSEKEVTVYIEGEKTCEGNTEKYEPESFVAKDEKVRSGLGSHGGSDFYPTHLFIEKILGKPDGKWAIDVYKAVDMGICGILAYRSILNGNIPVKIPDLRNKEERDAYRNDISCTDPKVAGEKLIPCSSYPEKIISEEESKALRSKWEESVVK